MCEVYELISGFLFKKGSVLVVVVNFLDAFVSLMCGVIEVRYLAYVKQSFLLCMQIRLQTSNGLFSCDSMYLLTKEYIAPFCSMPYI